MTPCHVSLWHSRSVVGKSPSFLTFFLKRKPASSVVTAVSQTSKRCSSSSHGSSCVRLCVLLAPCCHSVHSSEKSPVLTHVVRGPLRLPSSHSIFSLFICFFLCFEKLFQSIFFLLQTSAPLWQ